MELVSLQTLILCKFLYIFCFQSELNAAKLIFVLDAKKFETAMAFQFPDKCSNKLIFYNKLTF